MSDTLTVSNINYRTISGSTITASTITGSVLNISTLSFQSTVISLGQSTNQRYTNFTSGSFAPSLMTSTLSTYNSLSTVTKVSMSQDGRLQYALQSVPSTLSYYQLARSADTGVTWNTLNTSTMGLPQGSLAYQSTVSGFPTYSNISQSATGQYALASVSGGQLYVSNNASSATPVYTPANVGGAPYAYLPMDSLPITDMMGNSAVTVTGSAPLVAGKIGTNAINLVNTAGGTATNYVRGTWTGATNFTVSFWFNARSVGANQLIFGSYNTQCDIFINSSNALTLYIPTGISSNTLAVTGPTISQNTWYNVVVVFQTGGACSLYVNGTFYGSATNSGALPPCTEFCLGTYGNGALTFAFNGYIDDFRLYNFAAPNVVNPFIYLPLDGNVVDAMGNTSVTPTGSPGYVPGIVGTQAISFANTAGGTAVQYIRGAWTYLNNFTVSLWVNFKSIASPSYQIIYSSHNTYVLFYVNPSNQLVVQLPSGTGSTFTLITTTFPITINTWYQLTMIFQINGLCSFYVNNSLIGTFTNSGGYGSFTSSGFFGLGVYDTATNFAFNGYIDDLRIYNYAVTPSVIAPLNWSHTAVSGTGQYMMAAAANGGVFYSINYGQSWSQLTATQITSLVPTGGSAMTLMGPLIQPNNAAATAANWTANGVTWTASASSLQSGQFVYQMFDTVATQRWQPSSTTYTTSGNTSGIYTTIQGIGSIQGDWAQLQSSVPLVMYSYLFTTGYIGTLARLPKNFYIVGSNDGSTWYPIQSAVGGSNPSVTSYTPIANTIIVNSTSSQTFGSGTITGTTYSTTTNAYTYFRLITFSTYTTAADALDIGEWIINFSTPMPLLTAPATAPSTATSAVTVTPQMTNLPSGSTTVGTASGSDTSAVKTTWTTTNGVTWTVSASTTFTGLNPYFVFDSSLTSTTRWATNSGTSYTTTANTSGVFTTILGGIGSIQGDWLQIQSSTPLAMNSYQFATGEVQSVNARIPKDFYIVGSTDGTNWYPIQRGAGGTNPTTTSYVLIPNTIFVNSTATQTFGSGTITGTTYSTTANTYTYFRLIMVSCYSSPNLIDIGEWYPNFTAYTPNPVNALAITNGGQNMLVAATGTTMPNSSAATSNSWTANGVTWTTLASTFLGTGYNPYMIFDYTMGNTSTIPYSRWVPSSNTYRDFTPGNTSGITMTIQGIGSVQGDWVQLQSSVPLIMYSYQLATGFLATRLPKTYYIVGSNDGSTWFPIQSVVGGTVTSTAIHTLVPSVIIVNFAGTQIFGSSSITTTIYSTTTTAYVYFRLVCLSSYSTGVDYLDIGEWFINFQSGATYLSTNYGASWSTVCTAPPNAPILATSGNGLYTITGSGQLATVYSNAALTAYTIPTLTGITANINCASISSTGQNMIILTQGTTNNVFYSTNFGVTFTGMTVGTLPMTSCAISADGNEIMVSNAANVWTLNRNTQGFSITMGNQSGLTNQGQNSIAIGNLAGVTNQSANSIILNASGVVQDAYNPGFFVSPVLPQATSTQTSVNLLGYGADNQVVQSGLTVLSNGYTGIGTAAFGAYLQVYNSNAAFTSGPTVHIGDGQTDMGNYGMLQLVRANNGADNKAHLAFIKNGLSVFGMGYYPGTSVSAFGLVPSFGTMATNTGLWMSNVGNVGIGTTNPFAPLDVNGSILVKSLNNCGIVIAPGSGNFCSIECFNYTSTLYNTVKYPICLNAYGGNVGIGITNPSYTLDVNGLSKLGGNTPIRVYTLTGTFAASTVTVGVSLPSGVTATNIYMVIGYTVGTNGDIIPWDYRGDMYWAVYYYIPNSGSTITITNSGVSTYSKTYRVTFIVNS